MKLRSSMTSTQSSATSDNKSPKARKRIGAIPSSTYRLQVNSEFTLQHVVELLDYLRELGVGAIYSSPILAARAGSSAHTRALDCQWTARRGVAPPSASSRASAGRAACGGTCRSRDDGPSDRRRSRPAPPHRARSRSPRARRRGPDHAAAGRSAARWRSARQSRGRRPRSCQIAIALRPRPTAATIRSRYGSHALAHGARPGGGQAARGGEHLPWRNGRFWCLFSSWSPAHRDPGRPQVGAGRRATDAGVLLNLPKRPAQTAQDEYLLLLARVQDVPHGDRGTRSSSSRSTSRPTGSGNCRF